MGGLGRRLQRLEEQGLSWHQSYEDWPLEDQREDVLSYVAIHMGWGSRAACTDQQLHCIGLWLASKENPDAPLKDLSPVAMADFPEELQEHVSRIEPRSQPERDAWLREQAGYFVRDLEEMPARLARFEEEQRARAEQSRRLDREFLNRNRAKCGLPLLESDE